MTSPQPNHEHWLILSHCFNMDGRAASQTITDKLPHLAERGITFSVLSGVSGNHDQRFEHLQLLPWGPSGLRFDLRHLVAMRFGRGVIYRLIGLVVSLLLAPFIVIERLLFGLQSHASWALPATLRSLWLIRKHKPTVVYSTGGAYSAHIAGLWLKKLTGIKWIAEIHDPMVFGGGKKSRNEKYMARLEGEICRHADLVWWFTEGALESARKRHPELGSRGVVILPGVEPFKNTARYKRGEQMIIGHFGSLSPTRSLKPVVTAMAALLQKRPELRGQMLVHIYGGSMDAPAQKEIEQLKLQDVFIGFGRLEYSLATGKSGREQVVDLMHRMDCLLMVHGNLEDTREYIPSKVYEYFWTGRPIIALTHQNPQLDRMLHERNCYVADYDDVAGAASLLEKAYADWRANRLPLSDVPAIGTEQAVDGILSALQSR
ncbi:MAG TPA: glycosyltransferase [Gallionellaceae bacterium]